MTPLNAAKRFAIFTGFYGPARALHRALHPRERRQFRAHQFLYGQFVKPGDLTFDVGANVGNRTDVLLSLGASVVAFEPQPICAREVAARANTRLTVVQKAVGETEGSGSLYLKSSSAIASLVPNWEGSDAGIATVAITTLDKEIKRFGLPAFCKIDVEGYEVEVLRGLSHRIPAISLEYHCDEQGIENVSTCLALLSALGTYRVNLTAQEDGILLSPNWLSVPDFIKSFPHYANGRGWGDLFVKITD